MTTVIDLRPQSPSPGPPRVTRDVPREVRRFRPDIEGLRAVAVTLVVFSHLGLGFAGGYVGVDVFFVISGFLITRQLMNELGRRNRISFAGFYARRAKRILPAATFVIVGTVLALWKWDSPLRLRQDVIDGVFSGFSGINWRLASSGTDYFDLGTQPSAFQHYWSLAVEEQFYIVWPLLLLLVAVVAGRRWGRKPALLWTLIAIMAVSLILSAATTTSSPSWAYFGTQTRAWELALGAFIGVTVTTWTKMPPALACQMSWAGLIMIAISAFTFDAATVYPGTAVILPVVGSGFVIAGGCPGWGRSGELVLKQLPFQFVGRTSYSWYLTHWPILVIVPLALSHPLTTGEKWLVLGGSFALAVLMYFAIENPLRNVKVFTLRKGYGLGFGALLISCSVIMSLVVAGQGTVGSKGGSLQAIGAPGSLAAVEQAVAQAVTIQKLPAVLTPALSKAATDRPARTSVCLGDRTVSEPPADGRCTFGDLTASRTMAVIGDSHANQWIPAFDAYAKANHWKFVEYAKAACSPGVYLNYVDPSTDRLYTQCNSWREAVFAQIKKLQPTYTIIAAEIRTVDIDPTGMLKTIETLQASGSKVIYLEDTPNPLAIGNVPDCLAEHPSSIQKCSLARAATSTRLEAMVQRRVEIEAASRAGATLINPTAWFCTATTCPTIVNGIVVYADNSHITASYATWLAPVMSASLKKIAG